MVCGLPEEDAGLHDERLLSLLGLDLNGFCQQLCYLVNSVHTELSQNSCIRLQR